MPALGILAGRGYVSIVPDLARFNSQLAAGVNSSLAGLSKSGKLAAGLSSIGSSLTKFVSLPLAVAGAASVKMALDFESSFAKIGALAGNLGVSLEEAKQHVLDLAGQTAQSPKELTDALYFVASAGLKADQVMSVLDASAKGAAVGMGTASQIAQTLTSVLNAYAGTGLTASNAMNIMTQAVKSGKAEMTDFATGLGPVIGVAAQAGVSFNDLAAAIAQATNLGLPFDRAVTGMRFLIQSLEAPTAKSVKALDSIGVSVSDLHAQLAQPGGLQTALQELAVKFDLSTEAGRAGFAAVVGGARGSVVAMDLVGKHTEQTNAIVRDLGRAAQEGATDFEKAYAKVTGTTLFKARQAIEKFRSSFTSLGIALLPTATKLIGFVTDIANAFAGLSPHAQDLAIKFGAIAFAAGPVLKTLGGIIGIVPKLAGALVSLGGGAQTAATGISNVGTAAGPAASKLGTFVAGLKGLVTAAGIGAGIAAVSSALSHLGQVHAFEGTLKDIGLTQEELNSLSDEVTGFWSQFNIGATGGSRTTARALADVNKAFEDLVKAGYPADQVLQAIRDSLGEASKELGGFGGGLVPFEQKLLAGLRELGFEVPKVGEAVRLTSHQVMLFGADMINAGDATSAAVPAILAYYDMTYKAETVTKKQAKTLANLTDAIYLTGGSLTKLEKEQVANLLAAGDFGAALAIVQGALDRVTGASGKTKGALNKQATAHQQTADAAKQDAVEHDGLAGAFGRMTGKANPATKALKNMESAHQAGKDAAIQQGVEDAGLAGAFGRMGGAASTAGGKLKGLKGDHDAAGGAATGEKGKVDNLNTSLGKIPASKKTTFETPNLDKSYTAVFNYSNLLGNVPRTIKTVFQTVGSAVGGGSSGGSKAPQPPKYKPPLKAGAIFPPGYAGGALFRTPFGHEFIAGEGTYPTLFGRGGEIVTNRGALPLPDRIIDRLGDRIAARAHWVDDMSNMSSTTPMPRGGVRGRPIVIQVMVDRREIARAHANSAVWDN